MYIVFIYLFASLPLEVLEDPVLDPLLVEGNIIASSISVNSVLRWDEMRYNEEGMREKQRNTIYGEGMGEVLSMHGNTNGNGYDVIYEMRILTPSYF